MLTTMMTRSRTVHRSSSCWRTKCGSVPIQLCQTNKPLGAPAGAPADERVLLTWQSAFCVVMVRGCCDRNKLCRERIKFACLCSNVVLIYNRVVLRSCKSKFEQHNLTMGYYVRWWARRSRVVSKLWAHNSTDPAILIACAIILHRAAWQHQHGLHARQYRSGGELRQM